MSSLLLHGRKLFRQQLSRGMLMKCFPLENSDPQVGQHNSLDSRRLCLYLPGKISESISRHNPWIYPKGLFQRNCMGDIGTGRTGWEGAKRGMSTGQGRLLKEGVSGVEVSASLGKVGYGDALLPVSFASRRWPAQGVHVFQCADQLGIVARISECVASRGANILNIDLHIDFEAASPTFYSRSEFSFCPEKWPRERMEADFAQLAQDLKAEKSIVRVMNSDSNLRMAVLASRQDHCLVDLLYRWQQGLLPVNITSVISNHSREPNTHVMRFLERHGIAYHHVISSKDDRNEGRILDIVDKSTDFLVLARYMQVLSGNFLAAYGRDIINIHHGLLPSFKGANPYRQAFQAGVKLIGATSHFVTEDLDDGPIIEQLVDRVSHRDGILSFAAKSETLEKQCLATAVKYYCEHRILRYSKNKTIVFV